MNPFQAVYDTIKNFKTPSWLKVMLKELQDIIVATLLQIGKNYLAGLEAEILRVNDLDMTNEAKFKAVFKWGKANIPNIKDASLNLIIELIYSRIKQI